MCNEKHTRYQGACLMFILCLLILPAKGYTQNKMQGKVVNAENGAVPEAVVTVIDKETKQALYTTATDSLGRFLLPTYQGRLLLDVAAYGYEDYTSEISASSSERPLMVRLNYLTIDEVVVTANAKPRMLRDGNKVLIDKLENSPHAKGSDLYTFMRFIPVLKVPTFEGNITLRETAGGNATLLVNGKNIHIPMDAYLKNVRVEDVERIEVVAHPMGEYKVSGENGVINLIMKKREDEGVQCNLSVTDRQIDKNSQNGTFSLSYTSGKTYMTAGIFANHACSNVNSLNDYRFYTGNRQTIENNRIEECLLMLSGYFNMDYELNKRNTFGIRLGVGGNNTNNKNETESKYKRLGYDRVDSVYLSQGKTDNPSKFTNANANLNYTLKTDDKGSMFYADFDYRMSRPQSNTHNLYTKLIEEEAVSEADVIQQNRTKIDSYGIWLRYNHRFTGSTMLFNNLSFYASRARYDYVYGNRKGAEYTDDAGWSNCLDFDDYTLSASSTLLHQWSPKLNLMFMLAMNVYGASGKQRATGDKISRHDINFAPSLHLTYRPVARHVFSLSASCTTYQPGYRQLNPFKTYLSPTTYHTGNPHLKSNILYQGGITYNFLGDYTLLSYVMYGDNLIANLKQYDKNNQVQILPVNRGSMLYHISEFSVDKDFFDDNLNISMSIDYLFRKYKNTQEGMFATEKVHSMMFDASISVVLSNKHRLSTNLSYDYSGKDTGSDFSIPARHGMTLNLTKRFNYSSLSIGVRKYLRKQEKTYYEQPDYGYTTWKKDYWMLHASYSITFGNKKTRNVEDRANEEMKGRLQ